MRDSNFRVDNEIDARRKRTNGFVFYEVAGIVSLCSPANTLASIDHLYRLNPDVKNWELEEFVNHFHLHSTGEREGLRISQKFVAQFAITLREAYPERNFVVICHSWGEIVSFYEMTVFFMVRTGFSPFVR